MNDREGESETWFWHQPNEAPRGCAFFCTPWNKYSIMK